MAVKKYMPRRNENNESENYSESFFKNRQKIFLEEKNKGQFSLFNNEGE
jgi:hypothetical protein